MEDYNFFIIRDRHHEKEKGVTVYCSAVSSYASLFNCIDSNIKLSVRPSEVVQFNFEIANDDVHNNLVLNFVAVASSSFFTMINREFDIGSKPQSIRPNQKFGKIVDLSFTSPETGTYETTVMFSFKKVNNDRIILTRRVIVTVVDSQLNYQTVDSSPFTSKPIIADTLYKTTVSNPYVSDRYKIPAAKEKIFSQKFELRPDATPQEKALAKKIQYIFGKGPTLDNYVPFFQNLLWFEETIGKSILKKYNMSRVSLQRIDDHYLLVVPGVSEKRPSLMPGDLAYVKPSFGNVMFESIIAEVLMDAIYIRGFHKDFDKYNNEDALFDIRFVNCRVTYERMHHELHTNQGTEMYSRVFPKKVEVRIKVKNSRKFKISKFFNPTIKENEEQVCAIEHIVTGSSGAAPYLIHGPPGTGKTVTVVETILQVISRNPSNRVLVCADSNMAADHLAVQIVKYASHFTKKFMLRVNAKLRTWETMPAVLEPYSNGTSQYSWNPVRVQELKKYQIVVTTVGHSVLYASLRRRYGMSRHVTHLFIDEAAQVLEPLTLLPVCSLLAARGALVLAGDPLQLGPVVVSTAAKDAGLGISLMERLKNTCELYSDERNDPNYIVMLRNNFRSHPDIIELPNKFFYKNQLRASAPRDPLSTLNILTGAHDCRGIAFHAVLSIERTIANAPSYFNPLEQILIHRYVLALVERHKVPFEDIGIITPYNRQMHMIRCWLNIKGYDGIEVGTVEAFQGKEKRFILISTVRASPDPQNIDAKSQLGFLVDEKRFNVAITRAKAKVVIIGNPLSLNLDDKWRGYIQRCRELGTYYGYDYEINNKAYEELALSIASLRMQAP